MAEPLAKRDHGGNRYVRPTTIEVAIDAALTQDHATLRRRAEILDRRAPDFLPSEVLVHLVRAARRRDDDDAFNTLLPRLLTRCEANLKATLCEDRVPSAADLREEALSCFAELFAVDGRGDNPDELDYFEVRFNSAFAAFRIDVVRADIRRLRRQQNLPDSAEPATEDEGSAHLPPAAFLVAATQEGTVFRSELLAAIDGLPLDERDAVVLVHYLGYKEESEDPTERTAATICGVTGRTIRNRLKRARAKLVRFKEES